jgi:hypothetical protein
MNDMSTTKMWGKKRGRTLILFSPLNWSNNNKKQCENIFLEKFKDKMKRDNPSAHLTLHKQSVNLSVRRIIELVNNSHSYE